MPKRRDQGGWPDTGFARRLKEFRLAAGLTQGELAERAGCNKFTVAKLEAGKQVPAWPLVLALAKALDVDCSEFVPAGRHEAQVPRSASLTSDEEQAAVTLRVEEDAEETQLLERMRAGDMRARDALIALAGERLLALTRYMLRRYPSVRRHEQTDDVLQNVLVRLMRALREMPVPESSRHWWNIATQHIRWELLELARRYGG